MTDKKETAVDAMAGDGGYETAYLADAIRFSRKRNKNIFKSIPIYDGLKLIESGSNRGTTDYKSSADMLDITESQLRKIVERIKGMYGREPNSTITVIDYVLKLKESGINIDDVGIGEGKYQAGRIDHSLPYSVDNFEFVLQTENLSEREDRLKESTRWTARPVMTPFGKVESLVDAAEKFDINVATVKRWIDSGDEKYVDWFYVGEYPEKIAKILKTNNKRKSL